jgi:PAS domain S-box-containing protein
MEWRGDSLKIISEAAIIIGAVIMLFSIRYAHNIFKNGHARKYAKLWKYMFGLMILFLLGYITTLLLIIYESRGVFAIVTGLVFLLGSIFVYLAVRTSFLTITELDHSINGLEASAVARQQLEDVLQSNRNKLLKQNEALFYLTKTTLEKENLEQSLQLLTEKTAEVFEIERVSIWLFDEEKTYISCIEVFERPQGTHSYGMKLYKKDYPTYFSALETDGIIDATDALSDPRTKEYSRSYLTPLGITSMLDAPIHTENKLTGLLCNETLGQPKRWTIEEQSFAAAVTEIIAITIETFNRKKVAEQLILSESTFRNAFEFSGIGMALVSPEGKWMKVNKELCNIVGYSAEELLTKTFQDITHPDDLNADLKLVDETLKGERDAYKMAKRYFHKNGSIIWINLTVSLVRDKENKPLFFISQIEDVTGRKKTERDLELALSLTRATIESTADGILVVDIYGNITDYNQQFVKLWHVPASVIETKDRFKLLEHVKRQVVNPDAFEPRIKDIYAHPTDESQDILNFVDGRICARYSKPQMLENEIIGRVWSFRDITKQKHAEAVIKKMNADLESRVTLRTEQVNKLNEKLQANIQNLELANKDLESFSYSVSHDLRAPLRAINGFATLLRQKNTELDTESQQFLTTITNNAQKMSHLIEDLLSFSRLGKKELKKTDLDMNALVQDVLSGINIHEWNSNTKLSVGNMLPATGDEILIKQVFFNLISNSVKYSRTKENPLIEIGSHAGESENIYFVKDNGVGFSMEYYDKLFVAFQRMHSAEQFEGTGVGLAIVHRIIMKHGGRVWAEAVENEGATFYFTLPVEQHSTALIKAEDA